MSVFVSGNEVKRVFIGDQEVTTLYFEDNVVLTKKIVYSIRVDTGNQSRTLPLIVPSGYSVVDYQLFTQIGMDGFSSAQIMLNGKMIVSLYGDMSPQTLSGSHAISSGDALTLFVSVQQGHNTTDQIAEATITLY